MSINWNGHYVALRVNGLSGDGTKFVVDVHDNKQVKLIRGEINVSDVPESLVQNIFPFWIECIVRDDESNRFEPAVPFEFCFDDAYSYCRAEAESHRTYWNSDQAALFKEG